ncbi:hypothetical protein HDU97_009723, partial [Phlyctochytrium planicorne]
DGEEEPTQETTDHIWSCPASREAALTLLTTLRLDLVRGIRQSSRQAPSSALIQHWFAERSWTQFTVQSADTLTAIGIFRGWVPSALFPQLRVWGVPAPAARQLIVRSFRKFCRKAHERIWKPRCETTRAWEEQTDLADLHLRPRIREQGRIPEDTAVRRDYLEQDIPPADAGGMAFACFDAFALGGGIPFSHTNFQLLSDLKHEVRLEDDDVALPEPVPNYRDPPPLLREPRNSSRSWPGSTTLWWILWWIQYRSTSHWGEGALIFFPQRVRPGLL